MGEPERGPGRHLFFRVARAGVLKFLDDVAVLFPGGPVYEERELVTTLVQEACAPGGEPQDGGPAYAPVCDEQGAALLLKLRAVHYADGNVGGDASEAAEAGVLDVEREKGGDGGLEGVAERACEGDGFSASGATGSKEEAVALKFVALRPDAEGAVRGVAGGFEHGAAGAQDDAAVTGGAKEAVDDGAG